MGSMRRTGSVKPGCVKPGWLAVVAVVYGVGCAGAAGTDERLGGESDDTVPGYGHTSAAAIGGWGFKLQADGSYRCEREQPREPEPADGLGQLEQAFRIPSGWGVVTPGAPCPFPNTAGVTCEVPDNKDLFWVWDLPTNGIEFVSGGDAINYADANTRVDFIFDGQGSAGTDVTFTAETAEFPTQFASQYCVDFEIVQTNNGPYKICDRSLIVFDLPALQAEFAGSEFDNGHRELAIQHVFCHEIGHALGYPHSTNNCMDALPNSVGTIRTFYRQFDLDRTLLWDDGPGAPEVFDTFGF